MAYLSEALRYTRDTGNTGSVTTNYTAGYAAGTAIVIAVDSPVTGTITGWSASDSAGNTYTVVSSVNSAPANYQLAVLYCKLTSAVTTATTLTITVTGANPAKWAVIGQAYSAIASIDTAAVAATTGSGSSMSITAASSSSQANQTLFTAVAYTDVQDMPLTYTPDASSIASTPATASVSATPRSVVVQRRSYSANGTRSASGSFSAPEGWAAITVPLNATGGGSISVSLAADKSALTASASDTTTITATASDSGGAITGYSWSTTDGTLTGSGSTRTLTNTPSLTSRTATVSCTVTGPSGQATNTTTVTLYASVRRVWHGGAWQPTIRRN